MRMRQIGKTGISVSEICLGTGSFGGLGMYKMSGDIQQDEADRIVGLALDSGINFFDSAEIYSDGLAEEILGKALGARRKDAVIVTKVAPKRPSETSKGGFTYKHVMEVCEGSLKRLGTDYIDIFELHIFDPTVPLEETLKALDDLVRQGKVRCVGCSNFAGWQLMKALCVSDANNWARFTTLEAKYSLVQRDVENELMPLCVDQGIGILAYSPLHGGFLSGKYDRGKPWPKGTRFPSKDATGPWGVDFDFLYDIIDELKKIAEGRGVSVSDVALNYLLQKPAVTSLIIGVRNAGQLQANLTASGWDLTAEEVNALDRVSRPAGLYPYEDQKSGFIVSST
ncbi:MAG TPA: aldo/keto reductase [Papillibacter sp.]|jgi:aryl-alcohol dehydrogenase-like predicted oxidoreductase|nr:aldo/keto reductase [Papillibacter sp.]